MFVAHAVQVQAEGDARFRSGEAEAVAVAGEVRDCVAREEIHLISPRTEGEAVVGAGRGIELRLIEHGEAQRRNHRAVGDAEFLRHAVVVGEEPAADVHGGHGRIEQFDAIHVGRETRREHLVDHNRGNDGRGIICAGRSADVRARAPGRAAVWRLRKAGVSLHEREAVPVCRHWPGRGVVVGHPENLRAERMQQGDHLAAIVQPARVDAVDGYAGIFAGEGEGVAREHEELTGAKQRAIGEGEVDAAEGQSGKVERVGAGVLQFEELELIAVGQADVRRMKHEFRQRQP